MATEYNHLIESEENFGKNPNNMNNINTNKIYNNQNINMDGEYNNKILIEEDLNQNQNMVSSGFNPYMRPPQSLKWRNIMKIDLDLIRNSRDLSLLNSNLENIIYSDITEDDIQSVPEENVIKLIQILQFLNEFLLEQRQIINGRLISLKQEEEKLSKNQQDLEVVLSKQKDYLIKSKKEAKERLKEITDYKNAINALLKDGKNNLRGKNINITDINMDINRNMKNYGYNNYNNNYLKTGYKCKYCTGKVFPSEFELKKHLSDIHLISQFNEAPQVMKAPQNKSQITMPIEVNLQPLNNTMNTDNRNAQLEKQINDMRFEFQNQMHQFEMNKLKTQLLNQNNLDNKDDNIKEQIERMGNTFNDTLKQVLGVIANNQQGQTKIIKPKKKEKNPKLDEEINFLKNELAKAKLLSQEYDTKILNKKKEIDLLIVKKQEITTITQSQFKPKKTNLVPTQNLQLLYSKSILPKRRTNIFHSGELLSDHDESENERKKKEKMEKRIKKQITESTQLIDIITNIPGKKKRKLEVPFSETKLRSPNIPDFDLEEWEDLDHFYKAYKTRDKNFINKTKFNNYKRVVPVEFDEDDDININAKTMMRDGIKTQANFFNKNIEDYKIPDLIEVKDLKELDKNDLKDTIGKLFINIDELNKEGEDQEHFDSMERLLKLGKIKQTVNDLKE